MQAKGNNHIKLSLKFFSLKKLYLSYFFLTKQRMTQRASCSERSASSRTNLLEPLTIKLTVFAVDEVPVN